MEKLKSLPFLFSLMLLSCDKNSQAQFFDEELSQPFTDPRNGKQYKTVKTGNLVWMADNLDYETGDSLSWCYKDDCKKYWRLYHWEKAKNVCPTGWHLPTVGEWHLLDMAVFLLPDGSCDDIARFDMFLYEGWWTATSAEKNGTYIYNPKIKAAIAPSDIGYNNLSRLGCTVRCVQDNPYIAHFVLDSVNVAKLVKHAEITAYWLNSKAKEYERQFNKPVPECKQCTDLELLLMLEDAIKAGTAELDIVAKEENAALKAELKKAKADYERKFKIRAPWWYICSDKEHLERLQKAIKANKPELDYSYGLMNYKVGKSLAFYERRFKKPAPSWDEKECSDEERLERLTKALKENKPYLTKEEEKNRHSFHFRYSNTRISVNKTVAGTIAKYELPTEKKHSSADTLEANLSAEEWQNFTDTLQKLGVMEWDSLYIRPHKKGPSPWRGEKDWEVEIFLSDSVKFSSSGYFVYPPNWDEFIKLMNSIKKKTTQKLENKLKAEYEKRFKKPISEQELSTEQVRFSMELSNKTPIHSTSSITITRTSTGAIAHYGYESKEWAKLSTDDWLDFIYALYKSSFMKWDEEYGKIRMQVLFNDIYWLSVYNSNSIKPRSYSGYNKYPPNWDKFMKVMNDIRAKAKKDSAIKEVEGKLKAEYKKRFGKPISDFELSAKSMEFRAFSKWIHETVSIRLNRTSTGALIEYATGAFEGKTKLKEKLSIEEWLDFLNNLQKCPNDGSSGKWKRWDMCCRKNLNDYAILDISYLWHLEMKSSGDTDELKFYARDLCTPKWNEFMKTINKKKMAQEHCE